MRKLEERVVLDAAAAVLIEDNVIDIQPRAGGLEITANQGATVDEGAEHYLSAAELSVSTSQSAENVLYTITDLPEHGQILLNGTATTSFTQVDINNGLVSYINDGGETSLQDSFGFEVKDNLTGEASGIFEFTIDPVNDENPDIDLNGDDPGRGFIADFVEDSDPIAIVNSGQVAITDGDSNAENIESISIRLTNNLDGANEFMQVDVGDTGIEASLSYVNGEAVLTLTNTASIEAYESVMNTLQYGNNSEDPATDGRVIQVTAFDGENSSTISTILVNVEARNDAPTLSHPDSHIAIEETATQINGLSISDVDAGDSELLLSLSVSHGTLMVPTNVGLTDIQNNGSGALTLTGSLSSLNQALAALSYTGEQDFNELDELQLLVNDQGNSGSGGALTASSSMIIDLSNASVSAVNDAPIIAAPATVQTVEDNAITFTDISISDVDANDDLIQVTLTAADGEISLAQTNGLNFSQGNGSNDSQMVFEGSLDAVNAALNGLSFTPAANFTGDTELAVAVNDQSLINPGPLTDQQNIAITVTPENDLPELEINQTLAVTEPALPAMIEADLLAAVDPDNSADELRFTLTSLPDHGELMLDGSPLAVGDSFLQDDIDNGRLSYVSSDRDSDAQNDGFEFQLSDPESANNPSPKTRFNIVFGELSEPGFSGIPDSDYVAAKDLFPGQAAEQQSAASPAPTGGNDTSDDAGLSFERPDYLQNGITRLTELSLAVGNSLDTNNVANATSLTSINGEGILRSCSEVGGLGACNLAASENLESRLANAQPELLGRYMNSGLLTPQQLTEPDLMVAATACDHLNEPAAVFADDYRSQTAESCPPSAEDLPASTTR